MGSLIYRKVLFATFLQLWGHWFTPRICLQLFCKCRVDFSSFGSILKEVFYSKVICSFRESFNTKPFVLKRASACTQYLGSFRKQVYDAQTIAKSIYYAYLMFFEPVLLLLLFLIYKVHFVFKFVFVLLDSRSFWLLSTYQGKTVGVWTTFNMVQSLHKKGS